jgi:Integrase core domain
MRPRQHQPGRRGSPFGKAHSSSMKAWFHCPSTNLTSPCSHCAANGSARPRRDRDRIYGARFIQRVLAMGIRDRPISPRSPWQNGYAERLIGSIRRDCLDHVVVFGEPHLRNLLRSYQRHYNEGRTHLSLCKDAPIPRAVHPRGHIVVTPILGGLHHQYGRV